MPNLRADRHHGSATPPQGAPDAHRAPPPMDPSRGTFEELSLSIPQYESLAEAAGRVGCTVKTLRRRIADGQLPAQRLGTRLIRVIPEDVDALFRRIPAAA
jgi:excisionase family DNA binding protein